MYMGVGATLLHGTVTDFDHQAGTGSVTTDDATTYPFHCIEIADGTRTIEAGTRVTFERLARFGRFQAAAIRH
jgi:CspA family cold shock protein